MKHSAPHHLDIFHTHTHTARCYCCPGWKGLLTLAAASLHTHAATTHNNAFESMYLSQSECGGIKDNNTAHGGHSLSCIAPVKIPFDCCTESIYKIEILKFLGAHVHLPLHSISQRNRPYMRARFYLMSE